MGYEPTVWNTGDVVTSEKLNKLEEGVASAGPLVLHILHEDPNANTKGAEKSGTKGAEPDSWFDKTWQEIFDAFGQGKTIVFPFTDGETYATCGEVLSADVVQGSYNVQVLLGQDGFVFSAPTKSAYPGGNI